MNICGTISEFQAARDKLSGVVALVPTMGNLHAGHLSLIEVAKQQAQHVIVTIYVNPMQFGPNEDLNNYPRTMEADIDRLSNLGVDIVFTPTDTMIYPEGIRNHTRVEVPNLTQHYCGANRPGHFTGVATIVLKLFNLTQPDIAIFGKKDYQQLAVIRKLVSDMGLRIKIVGVDTKRESSGLAMSSRNQYLSNDERQQASQLFTQLMQTKKEIMSGNKHYQELMSSAIEMLENSGFEMEYFVVADQSNLLLAEPATQKFVILTAGKLGNTRLIDNIDFEVID